MLFTSTSVLFIAGFLFFFNDTATTEIYTLSLHDALPICGYLTAGFVANVEYCGYETGLNRGFVHYEDYQASLGELDRKSTRLNSSHGYISYAVFCLKKKKKHHTRPFLMSDDQYVLRESRP